jgi:hypothetical protein
MKARTDRPERSSYAHDAYLFNNLSTAMLLMHGKRAVCAARKQSSPTAKNILAESEPGRGPGGGRGVAGSGTTIFPEGDRPCSFRDKARFGNELIVLSLASFARFAAKSIPNARIIG